MRDLIGPENTLEFFSQKSKVNGLRLYDLSSASIYTYNFE